ncbi:MAG TPA: hypothetical protein VF866_01885, partial [Xanthobacteraceae bacterium]
KSSSVALNFWLAGMVASFPSLADHLGVQLKRRGVRRAPLCRGDTPHASMMPAEPATPCDNSADNTAIFRDPRRLAATSGNN